MVPKYGRSLLLSFNTKYVARVCEIVVRGVCLFIYCTKLPATHLPELKHVREFYFVLQQVCSLLIFTDAPFFVGTFQPSTCNWNILNQSCDKIFLRACISDAILIEAALTFSQHDSMCIPFHSNKCN